MYFITLILISFCFTIEMEDCAYDLNSNTISITFDNLINTQDVLLGLMAFSDGTIELPLTGGEIVTEDEFSQSVEISLIYGEIIDSRGDYNYWGNTGDLAESVENMDLENLILIVQPPAFVSSDNQIIGYQEISVETIYSEDIYPVMESVYYDCNINMLTVEFDRIVQFDQLAEDRASEDDGPGNQQMDGNPTEDENDNGVLDMEQNIDVFKIGFSNDYGVMNLEGFDNILQVEDDTLISIYLTNLDAKKLESSLLINDTSTNANVSAGAFRDTNYNSNIMSSVAVTTIPDSILFVANSSSYNLSDNEMQIFFTDCRDVTYTDPTPIWSKFSFSDGENSISLSGIESVSTSGSTLKLRELLFSDQAAIENMISSNYEQGESSFYLSIEEYSVYDVNGNGNVEVVNIPIEIIEDFESPVLDEIFYDALENQITLNWSPDKINYYKSNKLSTTPELYDVSGIRVYSGTEYADTLEITTAHISRNSTKKETYLDLTLEEAGWIEFHSSDSLIMEIDAYTLYSSGAGNNSGNFTINLGISYNPDVVAPSVESAILNEESDTLHLIFDKNISLNTINLETLNVIINSETITLTTSVENMLSEFSDELYLSINETQMQSVAEAIPNNNIIEMDLVIPDSTIKSLDGVWKQEQTIDLSFGKNFWNKSFRAFAETPEEIFCSFKYLSDNLMIFVEDSLWNIDFDSSDIDSIVSFFSETKETLESYHGSFNDIDENGVLIFVLYDISDEYGKGKNDTNASLFTHGYFSLNAEESDEDYANGGDIIYLDINPQIVWDGEDEKDFNETMFNAISHEYTKLLITQNENIEEEWLIEGLAYLEQLRTSGDVKFFGNNTNPSAVAGNQLTYLSNSLKTRYDQWNIYLFLNYLFEKYTNTDGWDIINNISLNDTIQGLGSIDTALVELGFEKDVKDIFLDYAIASFLDMEHQEHYYDAAYAMDAVDLYGAPDGKNAGVMKFNDISPPPYSFSGLNPWSYSFYLIQGYSVSQMDSSIIALSPLLDPQDTLIFDGYDGINYKASKIMLRSGYSEPMSSLFEVVDLEIDQINGKGFIPVTTNSITINDTTFNFTFKDTTDYKWTGVQNMAIVVAKVDDEQPPVTYDFVLTNIQTPPNYSDFYVFQNVGARNYLDLYVASERTIFDEFGVEGPQIEVQSLYDTTIVLLEPSSLYSNDYILYHNFWELGNWDSYSLIYSGTDQHGIAIDSDTIDVSLIYSQEVLERGFYSPSQNFWIEFSEEININTRLISFETGANNHLISQLQNDDLAVISSTVAYFGPSELQTETPFRLTANLPEEYDNVQLYSCQNGDWINLGGHINNGVITISTNRFGYFAIVAGEEHYPVDTSSLLPEKYILQQNYPNPFNATTQINYGIPHDSHVNLSIYDLKGRQIAELVNAKQPASWYSVIWDGANHNGQTLSSGVYFITLKTNQSIKTQKMVLLK